jgi:hypothetical protein
MSFAASGEDELRGLRRDAEVGDALQSRDVEDAFEEVG